MYEKVPQELKELPQWVCWRLADDPGKDRKKKLPIDPRTGDPARSNDPATWASYEDAVAGKERFRADGIGIMFAGGIFGIDLDRCIDQEGQLLPFAREIVETVQSYTELSPSGTGLHILCAGRLPEGRRRKGSVEMYSEGRFFTVTGCQVGEEYPFSDCTQRVRAMHRKYLGEDKPRSPQEAPPRPLPEMSPDEIIRRASAARRGGERFDDFMAGRWSQLNIGDGSQSSADQAFCNALAFWCRRDEGLMDAIFRQSGMMRPKWDQRRGGMTYGQRTIRTAIRDCREVWEPPKHRQEQAPFTPSPAWEEAPPQGRLPARRLKPSRLYSCDDTGNARRFVDSNLGNIRFNHIDGVWLCWNGHKWAEDQTGEIKRRADQMLDAIRQEINDAGETENTALRRHLSRSRSSRSKKAFIEEAKHLEGVPVLPSQLDRCPSALNVLNGIVSLKTGVCHRHNRDYLLSKLAGAAYDKAAVCPAWEQFIRDITLGDGELALYLQRMVGYCLTASVREQCIFFLYGTGSNGKSTFVDVISEIMGEYAMACQPETVMMRDRSTSARGDIARLRSARLVTTYEPNDGARLDEGIVKQLTGGDKVTARFLYGKDFEFRPEFKILMVTNCKPVIRGTDQGIWRRVKLIPFNLQVSDEKKDKFLLDKLRREYSGILNWAVAGAVGWHREGLPPCKAVDEAVREYRSEMDRVQQFIDDCIAAADGSALRASSLYRCYCGWCREQGDRYPMGTTKFYSEMKRRYDHRKRESYNEYQRITFTGRGLLLLENEEKRKGAQAG
jgi:putative DNA primase/helicase